MKHFQKSKKWFFTVIIVDLEGVAENAPLLPLTVQDAFERVHLVGLKLRVKHVSLFD